MFNTTKISNIVDLNEALIDHEIQMNNINIAMIRLEHESIITNNNELLAEGISDFLKKVKDGIIKFFKMIRDFIMKVYNKVKNFISGLFKKEKPDYSKIRAFAKLSAASFGIISALYVGSKIRKAILAGAALSRFSEFCGDVQDSSATSLKALVNTKDWVDNIFEEIDSKWGSTNDEIINKICGEEISKADFSEKYIVDPNFEQEIEKMKKSFEACIDSTEKTIISLYIDEENRTPLETYKISKIRTYTTKLSHVYNSMLNLLSKYSQVTIKASEASRQVVKASLLL